RLGVEPAGPVAEVARSLVEQIACPAQRVHRLVADERAAPRPPVRIEKEHHRGPDPRRTAERRCPAQAALPWLEELPHVAPEVHRSLPSPAQAFPGQGEVATRVPSAIERAWRGSRPPPPAPRAPGPCRWASAAKNGGARPGSSSSRPARRARAGGRPP